jgi:hypothetical protein
MMMKRVLLMILLFAGVGAIRAQILKPVKWSFSAVPVKGLPPEEVEFTIALK